MFRTYKEILVKNGKLFVTVSGNRYVLAECEAKVELKEELQELPCLGNKKAVVRRFATLLITSKHKMKIVDISNIELISFNGEFLKNNKDTVILTLTQCLPLDELDLTEQGENSFEVICSNEIITKLMAL